MEADPVVLAGYVLDSPESHPGSAIRMARWIVQHAAIVEAAKAQANAESRVNADDMEGSFAYISACRATNAAVRSERAP